MKSIGVLVVDDSAFMRRLLSDFINDDPCMHVVGIARDGQDAINKVQKWNPDVVTLDVELPDLSGLEVLKKLMAKQPRPVVMVSSLTQKGAQTTLDAITYGAIDFVAKPSGAISPDLHKVKEELLSKIRAAAKVNIRSSQPMAPLPILEGKITEPVNQTAQKIVCIGSSTGGPRSLQSVIPRLPKGLQAPVLIVQHLPTPFTATLAERLNGLSQNIVKEAEDGEFIENGTIYLAPGGLHMKVKRIGSSMAVELDDKTPAIHGLKPAFDVLLQSLADIGEQKLVTAVLTGMGSDGARGLVALQKNSKNYAIAESAETAVIFGMPKAAIRTGVVDEILPLNEIASAIVNQVTM